MKVAITGATGFLGWHVRCCAFARGVDCVVIGRQAGPQQVAALLHGVDAVLHCAGANRGSDHDVTEGNLSAAHHLADALRMADRPVTVVYANSVHARGDSPYGVAKRKAAEVLAGAAPDRFCDVLLPNLFGEHGRPHYHSFVATFCHEVAHGRRPAEVRDNEVALLHAQDAAALLLDLASAGKPGVTAPPGVPVRVREVLGLIEELAAAYQGCAVPELVDPLRTSLFNTYRSYLFPTRFPVPLGRSADHRGWLAECQRSRAGGGQVFISSTVPGAARGEHLHLRKFERFVVVGGQAEIALRRAFTRETVRFQVSGDQPAIVDMPTLWTHRLTSVGGAATTLFWTNQPFRPEEPDTFPCAVDGGPDLL